MISSSQTLLQDRAAAGRRLVEYLHHYARRPDVIILALPRGGVPVAYEVAMALEVRLDLMLVRKLGVPSFPCGSWLASDGGRSAAMDVGCDGPIAGRPAPTGICGEHNIRASHKSLVGAGLPAMAECRSPWMLDVRTPSLASQQHGRMGDGRNAVPGVEGTADVCFSPLRPVSLYNASTHDGSPARRVR
jgi:hypothetical protein